MSAETPLGKGLRRGSFEEKKLDFGGMGVGRGTHGTHLLVAVSPTRVRKRLPIFVPSVAGREMGKRRKRGWLVGCSLSLFLFPRCALTFLPTTVARFLRYLNIEKENIKYAN